MIKFISKLPIIFLIILIFTIIYSLISLASHNHFQTFAWDLGFFDQIIWKASRADFISYSTIAHENLLADHWQPVLYLLAPLYLVRSDVRIILVAQSFLVVVAVYPLYQIAISVSKNILFSLALAVAYLLFLGTQWTILNEFHQNAFVPLFLSIIFYSLHFKNKIWYWLAILGLLFTKEEWSLLVASLGIVVAVKYKLIATGLKTVFLGIIMFFSLVYFVMPFFSVQGKYSHFNFGEAGFTPIDVIKKITLEPSFLIKSMISPSVKLKTVFESFFAFGFLPLSNLTLLIPIIQQFVTRFIYSGPQFTKWTNVNHHAAPLGILLAVSTAYSVTKYYHSKKILTLIGIYLLFFAVLQDFILKGPLNSIFKADLYKTHDWMIDNYQVLKLIPQDVSVAAQNSLVPHLSQRNQIYLLPEVKDAEYIMIDYHEGPNKYAPLNITQMEECERYILRSGQYEIISQINLAKLFKRKNTQSSLTATSIKYCNGSTL